MEYLMLLSQDQDLFISSILLSLSGIGVIIFYLNRHHFGIGSNIGDAKPKGLPRITQREEYITARDTMDINDEEQLEKLKTLLMSRAIQTIPFILLLSDEGEAIEKLYKRGMLTDNMHIEVNEMKLFVDKEYNDVRAEADNLKQKWGEYIWPQAKEYYTVNINEILFIIFNIYLIFNLIYNNNYLYLFIIFNIYLYR
jgi:hypothetical protein